MKSRDRTHIKIFLLGGLLFSLFTAYLYFGMFPGRLKEVALEKIEALTQKKVVFDKALYLPFRGLNFENLKVMDKKGRAIFSARQLAIDAAFIPFFREKKMRRPKMKYSIMWASFLTKKSCQSTAEVWTVGWAEKAKMTSIQAKVGNQ